MTTLPLNATMTLRRLPPLRAARSVAADRRQAMDSRARPASLLTTPASAKLAGDRPRAVRSVTRTFDRRRRRFVQMCSAHPPDRRLMGRPNRRDAAVMASEAPVLGVGARA